MKSGDYTFACRLSPMASSRARGDHPSSRRARLVSSEASAGRGALAGWSAWVTGVDPVRRQGEHARDAQPQLVPAQALRSAQVEAAGDASRDQAIDGVGDGLRVDRRPELVGVQPQAPAGGQRGSDPFAGRRARPEAPAEHEGDAQDGRPGRLGQDGLLRLELGAPVDERRRGHRRVLRAHGAIAGNHEVGGEGHELRRAAAAQAGQGEARLDVVAPGALGIGLAAIGVRLRRGVHHDLGVGHGERALQRCRVQHVGLDVTQAHRHRRAMAHGDDLVGRGEELGQAPAQQAAGSRHQDARHYSAITAPPLTDRISPYM